MNKIRDITGRRFGSLVAIKRVGSDKRGHSLWVCECDCGRSIVNLSNRLLTGNTKTCGCRNGHGMRYTRIYRTWINMKSRCYDPNQESYRYYGAKGIRVCDEWKHDFTSFLKWASANGYSDNLTIDRKNPKLGYFPENCQWVTMSENSKKSKRKLSQQKVIEIRKLYEKVSPISKRKFYRTYCKSLGVCRGTIENVIRGQTWKL